MPCRLAISALFSGAICPALEGLTIAGLGPRLTAPTFGGTVISAPAIAIPECPPLRNATIPGLAIAEGFSARPSGTGPFLKGKSFVPITVIDLSRRKTVSARGLATKFLP